MSGVGKKTGAARIAKETVRRFHHLQDSAIARYLALNYPDLFKDKEAARHYVRRVTGKMGQKGRDQLDPELFRDKPVPMPKTWSKEREDYIIKVPGPWLVLNDIHVPFHEPKPIEAAIQWGQAEKVVGIFIDGDLFDFGGVAFWYTEKRDFWRELELCIDFLDFLRSEFPDVPIIYKPGNHEYRLPRYIVTRTPELADTPLAAVEQYMGFEGRGIEFLDYHQKVMFGKLPVFHGHEFQRLQTVVSPARGLFNKALTWAACGHCHNTSEYSNRDANNKYITTWSFGCLCNLSPDWNPFGNKWNWGCAIINFNERGSFEVENRKIMPSGRLK